MGFHLLNVALHGLASAIFVKMCLEVARVTTTCAFIAGLHFATHPVHTEAVSNTQKIFLQHTNIPCNVSCISPFVIMSRRHRPPLFLLYYDKHFLYTPQ